METGKSTLQSQANTLEKLALKYEIPLPERPPFHQQATIDPEVMEDRFIYRQILTGIQGSIGLHIRAAIETVRNDSVRKIFMDFLNKELSILNNFIKYGKTKGWMKIVPIFRDKA